MCVIYILYVNAYAWGRALGAHVIRNDLRIICENKGYDINLMHDDDDELSVCMAGKQIVNRNTCYGSNAKNKIKLLFIVFHSGMERN